MPYIDPSARVLLDAHTRGPKSAGELNYLLTMCINQFLADTPRRYEDFNRILGVLEACKLELYRRMIAPYEDKKIEENGDVYHAA